MQSHSQPSSSDRTANGIPPLPPADSPAVPPMSNPLLRNEPGLMRGEYRGPERRSAPRVPRTLEISVQPLDDQLSEMGEPFFAITRDISQGGLAFLSWRQMDVERVVISLRDGVGPGILCRVCNQAGVHASGSEQVCLTNVQFLRVHHP